MNTISQSIVESVIRMLESRRFADSYQDGEIAKWICGDSGLDRSKVEAEIAEMLKL